MNFTSTAYGLLKNLTSCLDPEQFPGLKPFEEKLAGLDLAALSDLVDPAKDPADDPSVDMKMGSGMTVRLYSDTIQEAAQPLLAGATRSPER